MSVIAVQKEKIERQGGMVILPIKEYRKLVARAVPTYYLGGKAARRLDKLVEEGLKEYTLGRTRKILSLADLV